MVLRYKVPARVILARFNHVGIQTMVAHGPGLKTQVSAFTDDRRIGKA